MHETMIHFTPVIGWTVTVFEASRSVDLPMVGWALVHTAFEDGDGGRTLEPVVLASGRFATILPEYLRDNGARLVSVQSSAVQ